MGEALNPDLEELFHRARVLEGPEREMFLANLSGTPPELLEHLRTLLEQDEEDTLGVLRASALPRAHETEVRVGRYRLLRVLGEGGMGSVHLAEQEEPVRRLVALKMVRIGTYSQDVAARFQAERQALALMNHPGIAEIHDGGVSDSGLPYFVMEYVPGQPLDRYCDEHELTLEERLGLFAQVCEAVQHAHLKGVIHRDLKCSNVLVGELDGKPVPKIIDFGIARAVAGSLAGEALAVSKVQVVGTTLFMSPEQARGEDVDTRTDVYSLGVMLYELVAGVRPWDVEKLGALEPKAALEQLFTQEPAPPSARVAALGADAEPIAERRGTSVRSLVRDLRGDVDWIVARATKKDRASRYATARELAADIARHRTGQPVDAAPPSTTYRLGKFVRRHWLPVSAVSLLVLISIGAALVSSALLSRAIAAERTTRYQAEKARGIVDHLELAIQDGALAGAVGLEPTLSELLYGPVTDVDRLFADRPAVEAGVLTSLGRMLLDLGEGERALEFLLRANALQQGHPEVDAYDRFETLDALIRAERHVHGPKAARAFVAETLAAARRFLVGLGAREDRALESLLSFKAGADVPGTEVLAGLDVLLEEVPDELYGRDPRTHAIGRVVFEVGAHMVERDLPETEQYYRQVDAKARVALGPGSFTYARVLWTIARSLLLPGHERPDAARDYVERLGEACRDLPEEHWLRREAELLRAQLEKAGD